MRIAEVIGTVTLCQSLPSFRGARLKLAVPLSLDNLQGHTEADAEPVVVWDELGAGVGDKIAMIEGPEGAQAFRPEIKPVDAYNSAILDHIDIDDQPAG
jgi:ethanolamine utilization protein EutN